MKTTVRVGQEWRRGSAGMVFKVTSVYSEWADGVDVRTGKKTSTRLERFGTLGRHGCTLVKDVAETGSEMKPIPGFAMMPAAVSAQISKMQGARDEQASLNAALDNWQAERGGSATPPSPYHKPDPSPLARVREAVECLVMNGQYDVDRARGRNALPSMDALERALPVLLEVFHATAQRVGNLRHEGKAWQSCPGCAALLEGT